jgi:hypothetical protein
MKATSGQSVLRRIERVSRYAIVAVFGTGLRQRNWGAVANAVLALVATSLPDRLERRYDVEFRPWQRLYVVVAMLLHAVGMLGPYDDEGWWDHVTHTFSATLLGGVVHATARRRGRDPRPRVLAAVGVGGLVWELLEYAVHAVSDRLGVESVLVPYSARDTALDLVFDLVGALLVLAFGDRLLGNFTRPGD